MSANSRKSIEYAWYAPRIWNGMSMTTWYSLLWRNGFRVSPARPHTYLGGLYLPFINSLLARLQAYKYRQAIEREVIRAPVFIIGHWRSGTTLLHNLLDCDPQFTAPDNYECFAPHHFLITGWLGRKTEFLLPRKRPMDSMALGWGTPQEDEFALLAAGALSPYEFLAFPETGSADPDCGNLRNLPPDLLAQWKACHRHFLQTVCAARHRDCGPPPRLVLKSPTHTARISVLRELYPDARFIHIVRHPEDVFASSVKLWRALLQTQALQTPRESIESDNLDDLVFRMFDALYGHYREERAQLPPGSICDVRYEDLIADPLAQLERVYLTLDLPAFHEAVSWFEQYLDRDQSQPQTYELKPDQRAAVWARWSGFYGDFGYVPRCGGGRMMAAGDKPEAAG